MHEYKTEHFKHACSDVGLVVWDLEDEIGRCVHDDLVSDDDIAPARMLSSEGGRASVTVAAASKTQRQHHSKHLQHL